jgi:hypothetical protein
MKLETFVSRWAEIHGTNPTATKDLLPLAKEVGLWPHVFETEGPAQSQRLGKSLFACQGHAISGWRIVRPKTRTADGKLWRLAQDIGTWQLDEQAQMMVRGNLGVRVADSGGFDLLVSGHIQGTYPTVRRAADAAEIILKKRRAWEQIRLFAQGQIANN